MKLRCFAFLLFGSVSSLLSAQSSTPGGSVRLVVLSGGNLDFVFNTISKYKNGITYTNWTVLGISVTDNAGDNNPPAGDDYTSWNLTVEALDLDGDLAITGVNPANTIPFSAIEVYATITAGCPSCNILPGAGAPPGIPIPVPPVATVLIDGSNAPGNPVDQISDFPSADNLTYVTDQIAISYRCGVGAGNSLLGFDADYYADDIVFTLEMDP